MKEEEIKFPDNINEEDRRQLKKVLRSIFLPVKNHMGFENAVTSYQHGFRMLCEVVDMKLITPKQKEDRHFLRYKFHPWVNILLSNSVRNPNSKWYIENLECERRGNVYYYYFPNKTDEMTRLDIIARNKLTHKYNSIQNQAYRREDYYQQYFGERIELLRVVPIKFTR